LPTRGILVVGLALLWAGLAPGQAAANNYGAIAYSTATGAHGWSIDYPSRSAAESVALQNCRKHGADCVVPIWVRNGCAALAVGSGNAYGSGWGTTRGLAESFALQSCRKVAANCAIRRWICTTR
jgi:serine/threonine-protein kinase